MATTTMPSLPCPVFGHDGTIPLRAPATTRSSKRARSHGVPSMTTLPDDALMEIFARLPAKSVGRLRCVSRSWAATLKSATFVDLHLREANQHQQQPTPKLFFTTAHPEDGWQLDEVLTKPCNGLVLIRRLPHHRHFVCNPSTGALLPLPDSHECRRRSGESYGLGYSPATKEYKVVRLFSSFRSSTPCCEVFSLGVSAHWRAVARQSPPSRAAVRGDPAVLCDGYLHFLQLVRTHGGGIATFDVGDESFGSLSMPPSVQGDDGPLELTALGGRLCLCVFHERRPPTRSDADPYCIWRLACRESGQWEKLYRVLHHQTLRPELDLLRVHWVSPLETYLAGNGQTKIMFATEEGVLAFDLEGGGVPVPEVLVSPPDLVSAGDDKEATITRGTVGLLVESLVPMGRTSEEVVFSSPWRKAWSDVLKWMPAQSVAALTCVCRGWRAVAQSDRFVRTHALHANLGRSPGVMVVRAEPYSHVLDLYPLEFCESLEVHYAVAEVAPPFLFDHRVSRTVCSTPCHGLVLVSYTPQAGSGSGVVDFICNPGMEYSSRITTDTLDDDDDGVDSPHYSAAATMGLGYDSLTNKHVLARLVVVRPGKSRRHHQPVKVKCHVQLLGDTAWIPISPPPRPPAVDVQPAYADGKLYWMVDDDGGSARCELLALDVGTREFEVLPGPPCDRGRATSVVELQGSVCVLCSDTGANAIDVWKRLEGGSWSAWPCRIELGEFRRMYPSEETTLLAVDPRDGRVLLSTGRALGYYDPEARALQTVYCVGEHLQDMWFAPALCHESLICPRTY